MIPTLEEISCPIIYRDSRESDGTIQALVPNCRLLEYNEEQHLSFDFFVVTNAGQRLKVERKALPDLTASWLDGKLDSQCAAVDLLIIETTVDHILEDRDPEMTRRALLHAGVLAANMWVHHTAGPAETVRFLEFLRDREHGITIRQNKLASTAPDTRWRLLEALPGVNPYRLMADGKMLGDHLSKHVNWTMVEEALWLHRWADMPWNGRRIPDASLEKVRQALRGERK